ncbi:MAG: pentapeptide repeat-containing protein [Candidatus Margulisiibacteriota bacterium]
MTKIVIKPLPLSVLKGVEIGQKRSARHLKIDEGFLSIRYQPLALRKAITLQHRQVRELASIGVVRNGLISPGAFQEHLHALRCPSDIFTELHMRIRETESAKDMKIENVMAIVLGRLLQPVSDIFEPKYRITAQNNLPVRIAEAIEILMTGDIEGWNMLRKGVYNWPFPVIDLSGAIFSKRDMGNACFEFVDLRKARFIGTDLSKANLRQAFLALSDLKGARISKEFKQYVEASGAKHTDQVVWV